MQGRAATGLALQPLRQQNLEVMSSFEGEAAQESPFSLTQGHLGTGGEVGVRGPGCWHPFLPDCAVHWHLAISCGGSGGGILPLYCPLSSFSLAVQDPQSSGLPGWAPLLLQPAWLSRTGVGSCIWMLLNEVLDVICPQRHTVEIDLATQKPSLPIWRGG